MRNLLIITVILVIGFNIHAQNTIVVQNNELLIYMKVIDGQKIVVSQIDNDIIYYPLQSNECVAVSQDKSYIALSQEQPSTLKIIHLHSQKIVFEIQWLTEWVPCEIRWN